jgi:hypothetical protein
MPYLLKTEPTAYSFADLQKDGETTWDGVKNPQALQNLAAMKPGEKLAFYHSVTEKAVVGTAKVVSESQNCGGQEAQAAQIACGYEGAEALRGIAALPPVSPFGGAAHGGAVRVDCRLGFRGLGIAGCGLS